MTGVPCSGNWHSGYPLRLGEDEEGGGWRYRHEYFAYIGGPKVWWGGEVGMVHRASSCSWKMPLLVHHCPPTLRPPVQAKCVPQGGSLSSGLTVVAYELEDVMTGTGGMGAIPGGPAAFFWHHSSTGASGGAGGYWCRGE